MIEIEDLYKSFNHRDVLNGVSLNVQRGEILAVIGGSGVGKSVLLKHITGLIRPDRGTIKVDGQEVTNLRGKLLVSFPCVKKRNYQKRRSGNLSMRFLGM
jgi:phospholipid/cholesterol/gamma-HCH transport system ATP-binding protein